jgi:hypothetical protein
MASRPRRSSVARSVTVCTRTSGGAYGAGSGAGVGRRGDRRGLCCCIIVQTRLSMVREVRMSVI